MSVLTISSMTCSWYFASPASSFPLLTFLGAHPVVGGHPLILNWLRVLGPTERAQVDQRVCHQLHAIMPLLDAFKAEQHPLELVFPRKGPLNSHPQRMDGGVEQPLAPALGRLAVARILCDVGNQPRVEDRLAIRLGIKTTIEVEVGSVEIDTHLFGHLFQRFQ